MTKENVVEFPKSKIVREVNNDDAINQVKERSRTNYAESLADDLIENILQEMDDIGIDTSTNEFIKDFSLTVDALRATVYRSLGVPHHLHDFIDANVKMINKTTGEPYVLDDSELIDTRE
jgi:hypothetical protein